MRKCLSFLLNDWQLWARDDQLPPWATGCGDAWRVWLILGGRGAGKTRAGAEWVRAKALGIAPVGERQAWRIALVGETFADVRRVMIEGVSGLAGGARATTSGRSTSVEAATGVAQRRDGAGLLGRGARRACAGRSSMRRGATNWRNGASRSDAGTCCSSGCAWASIREIVVTTTPRPMPLLKRLLADPGTVVDARGDAGERASTWRRRSSTGMSRRYGGTRARAAGTAGRDGRGAGGQRCGARDWIEAAREAAMPELRRIVVAVDPPATRDGELGRVRHCRGGA